MNQIVNEFYKMVGLERKIHGFDYLLMNMIGLQRIMKNKLKAYTIFGQALIIAA